MRVSKRSHYWQRRIETAEDAAQAIHRRRRIMDAMDVKLALAGGRSFYGRSLRQQIEASAAFITRIDRLLVRWVERMRDQERKARKARKRRRGARKK